MNNWMAILIAGLFIGGSVIWVGMREHRVAVEVRQAGCLAGESPADCQLRQLGAIMPR